MAGSFSPQEVADVLKNHPQLELRGPGELEGVLQLNHTFDGITVTDTFSVRITAELESPVPVLREVGGRTAAIALKYKLQDPRDLHCNPGDGTACVCVLQEIPVRFPPGSPLLVYIDDLAIPYLFGLSHFDRYGNWPWGEYSHGAMGLVEFYAKAPEQTKANYEQILQTLRTYSDFWPDFKKKLRNPGGQRSCICGSGRPFARCHTEAWRGIRREQR